MALTFDDAYLILQREGKAIGQLVKRGDKLALDVYNCYRDWHMHEWRNYRSGITQPDTRRRRAVVSALEQYLQRDLVEHERAELAGKKGHLLDEEADKDVPSNIIHLSVRSAIRAAR